MATINSIGSNDPIQIEMGGTEAATFTDHSVLVGSGVDAFTSLAVGATGELLVGNTGADPNWSSTVLATTFDTNVAAAAVTLAGTSLLADGTDADININITAKGTGQVIIDDLQLTTDLAVTEGGTGASTFTDGGLLVGAAAGPIEALAVGGVGTILTGVAGSNPTWTTATYPATAAIGTILIASGANTITTLAPDTVGHVLTDGGAGVAPSWVAPTVGTVTSVSGGTNISASGTAADPIMDLDAAITGMTSVTFATGGSLQTGTTISNTLLLQAYDTNLTGYVPFMTLTAADVPTCDLSTDVTIGTKYIYRADGTDVPVADGGTGASTFTDGGLLVGAAAGAIEALAVGGVGTILTGVAGSNPTWTTATYPATAAIGDVLVASAANVIGVATGGTTSGHVLTANGAGSAPTFQANAGGGIGTLDTDSGSATGPTVTITGGTNITTAGAAAAVTVNLDAALTGLTSVTMADTGSIQTTVVDTDTMLIQGYDVDGTAYVPFITITNANDPTCDLNTGVTIGTKYIYRADGTDVPVADGGTGASTFTDGGLLVGAAAGAIEALAVGGVGTILTGVAGSNPTWTTATYPATAAIGTILIASAANVITTLAPSTAGYVLTDGGAGVAPSWAAASCGGLTLVNETGTTYEFLATDANKMVTFTNAAAITVTVPVNADVPIAIGSQILCYQGGAGQVSFTPEGGVTINSPNADLAIYTQYSTVLLTKILTNTWSLSGDLA